MVDLNSQYLRIKEEVNAGIQHVIEIPPTFIKTWKKVNDFQQGA